MKKEQISQIISGADSNYVEEAKTINRLYSPKKLMIIGLVAALMLMLVGWTGYTLVKKQLATGETYTIMVQSNGDTTTSISTGIDVDVFEEIDGELYFIFDGNNQNITEYCSIQDYFAYENVDDNGNGYVIVVGGVEGRRGQLSFNYENGSVYASSGEYHEDLDVEKSDELYVEPVEPEWFTKANEEYGHKNFNFGY